jgi:hypothetical protein
MSKDPIHVESFESTLPLEDSYQEDLQENDNENENTGMESQRMSVESNYDSLNLSGADIAR